MSISYFCSSPLQVMEGKPIKEEAVEGKDHSPPPADHASTTRRAKGAYVPQILT